MNSEQETIPNNSQILKAIIDLQNEMRNEVANLRNELVNLRNEMNVKFEDIRLQMMSFDVRIDRLTAASHESLNLAHNVRADVKVLREEVHAWVKEVAALQAR
jgi:hypothetical protein